MLYAEYMIKPNVKHLVYLEFPTNKVTNSDLQSALTGAGAPEGVELEFLSSEEWSDGPNNDVVSNRALTVIATWKGK